MYYKSKYYSENVTFSFSSIFCEIIYSFTKLYFKLCLFFFFFNNTISNFVLLQQYVLGYFVWGMGKGAWCTPILVGISLYTKQQKGSGRTMDSFSTYASLSLKATQGESICPLIFYLIFTLQFTLMEIHHCLLPLEHVACLCSLCL